MPVCCIVKTITPRFCGRADALLHEVEGHEIIFFTQPIDDVKLQHHLNGESGFVAKQKISPDLLKFCSQCSAHSNLEKEYPHFMFLTIIRNMLSLL